MRGMTLNVLGGVVLGAASSALIIVLHAVGLLRTPVGGRLLMAALFLHAIVLIWVMSRHARDEAASFARLLGAGLAVSLTAAVVMALGSYVFVTAVDPSHLDWVREQTRASIAEREMSDADRLDSMRRVDALEPTSYAVQGLSSVLVTGFLLSVVMAALVRMRIRRQLDAQTVA